MITLSGQTSVAEICAIADGHVRVQVSEHALTAVTSARSQAAGLRSRFTVYGQTTGVGANREGAVDDQDGRAGLRLMRSHAADAGARLPDRAVRAMLAVRLNQLCLPGSGIAPSVLPALAAMLNADALPQVREFGSIGTGDLTALAGTALTLLGERQATRPLPELPPIAWDLTNALPFLSSGALTIGRTALAVQELARLNQAGIRVLALSFVALGGNPEPFCELAAKAAGTEGAVLVAAEFRRLLPDPPKAARIQDPYGLRVFPVSHGALTDAQGRLHEQVTRLMNAARENPLFDFADQAVLHHGSFFQAGLGLTLDAARLALAQTTPLALSRIRLLHEPSHPEASPFLAVGPQGSSGTMILEYVAASAIGELQTSASPASLGTVALSRGVEEDASFASQAVVQLERAVHAYRILLSVELVAAVRSLRQQGLCPAGQLVRFFQQAHAALPTGDEDRDLREDLDRAELLISDFAREPVL